MKALIIIFWLIFLICFTVACLINSIAPIMVFIIAAIITGGAINEQSAQ